MDQRPLDGRGVVKAILARRSTRDGYRPEPVDRELLEMVLACGLAAPSSKNAQPWRLHVVESRDLLRVLSEAMVEAAGVDTYVPHDPRTGLPYLHTQSTVIASAKVLRAAPTAVFIENLSPFSRGREVLGAAPRLASTGALVGYGLELIGIGAAIENMWVAAAALGLGAAFMGDVVIAEPEVRESLALKGDLAGVLVLGHVHGMAQHLPPNDEPSDQARVRWHR